MRLGKDTMGLKKSDLALSISAVLISAGIAAMTIIVVLIRIDLTNIGPYTGLQRATYATLSTIIASIITAFTTSQVRKLWLADIDQHFLAALNADRLISVERRWRAALSVGTIKETFLNWNVQTSFLITALITTSIVASLTPTVGTYEVVYDVEISTGLPWRCCTVSDESDDRYSVYEWRLPNGSYLSSGGNWAACPSRWAVTLMGGINYFNASQYSYSDLGVAVKSTALGAPISAFGMDPVTLRGDTFVEFIRTYGSNAVNITQCIRVMTSNPFSCHTGGKVSYKTGTAAPITITSDDGSCKVQSYGSVQEPEVHGAIMAKGICATGDPGQATIVMGATGAYARWLAVAINYPDRPKEDEDVPEGYTFAVTCRIDARNSFRYRNVTLSFQDQDQVIETNLGRQLSGNDEDCRTFNVNENLGIMGTVVSANWQPLSQNDGLAGWFDSINQMTIDKSGRQSRQPPYAFATSQNALEDTFGLVAAMATSRINGTTETVPANAVIINTRVGSGKRVGLLYSIPPILTAIIMLGLIIHTIPAWDVNFSSVKMEDIGRSLASRQRSGGWLS